MAGKGDDRRPSAVTEEELAERWRLAFGSTERRREEKARRIGQQELFCCADCAEEFEARWRATFGNTDA